MAESTTAVGRLVQVVAQLREHCLWTAALTHESLVEYLIEESHELAEAIAAEAARHVLGHGIDDGTTMGPMHNESQLKLVRGLVDSAVGSGARVITGGSPGCDLPGYFLSPTVVIDAEPGMDLVEQEQFGAALPIVAYDDLEATIAHLNAGEFGLGASVWSPDAQRAYDTASRIEAGTVWINQHIALTAKAPFTGAKWSGLGEASGRHALLDHRHRADHRGRDRQSADEQEGPGGVEHGPPSGRAQQGPPGGPGPPERRRRVVGGRRPRRGEARGGLARADPGGRRAPARRDRHAGAS